jgi:adenine-specific DNA-methyltransferase
MVNKLLQKNLRKYLFQNTTVDEIVHFKQSVFPKVTVDTEIVLLSNSSPKKNIVKVTVIEKGKSILHNTNLVIPHTQSEWIATNGESVNIFQSNSDKLLFKKLLSNSTSLENYFNINVGIKPYQVGKGKPKQIRKDVEERVFDCDYKKSNLYRKYLRGSDIHRYITAPLKERYIKYGEWLAEPRPAANFNAPEKIFMRQTGDSLIGTIDREQYLCLNNMHVLVPKVDLEYPILFYLGIINSRLLNWYYQTLNPEKGEALAEVKKSNVACLPIRNINKSDNLLCKELVKLVDQILKFNEEKQQAKLQSKIDQLQNRIDYAEQRINEIVYELYGLTKDEIAHIENA